MTIRTRQKTHADPPDPKAFEDRAANDGYKEVDLSLPGRKGHAYAPRVLECRNHPLTAHSSVVNRVFVMPVSTLKKDMERAYKWEIKQKVPEGTKEDWLKQGWVELVPGDFVFVRDDGPRKVDSVNQSSERSDKGGRVSEDKGEERDPEAVAKGDVLAVGVGGWDHFRGDHGAKFRAAIAKIATKDEHGQIEFLKSGKQVQGNSCFQVGSTLQHVKKLVSPSAAGKGAGPYTAYQQQVKDLIMATSAMASDVIRNFPLPFQEALKANNDLLNFPTVGVKENFIYPQVQVNISTVGGETGGLEQLGPQFGGAHIDYRDHPGYPAFLAAYPILPRGWHPGYFFVPSVGVFGELHPGVCPCFDGQRLHCFKEPHRLPEGDGDEELDGEAEEDTNRQPTPGTTHETLEPSDPNHADMEETGLRINTVLFTSKSTVDGNAVFALASKPCKSTAKKSGKKGSKGKGKGKDSTSESDTNEDADDEGDGNGGGVNREAGGAGDSKEPFLITPEMVNVRDETYVARTSTLATYASDGAVIMDADSHMNYVGRSILQHATYILRQMPEHLKINLDAAQFLRSITYRDEQGNIKSLTDWECAPGVGTSSETRRAARKTFTEYTSKVQKIIPSTARSLRRPKDTNSQPQALSKDHPAPIHTRRSQRLAKSDPPHQVAQANDSSDTPAPPPVRSVEQRTQVDQTSDLELSLPVPPLKKVVKTSSNAAKKGVAKVATGRKKEKTRGRYMWGTDMDEIIPETEQEDLPDVVAGEWVAEDGGRGMDGHTSETSGDGMEVEREEVVMNREVEMDSDDMNVDGQGEEADKRDRSLEEEEGVDENMSDTDAEPRSRGEKRTLEDTATSCQTEPKRTKHGYDFLDALTVEELTSELRRVAMGRVAWKQEYNVVPGFDSGSEWLKLLALRGHLESTPISEQSPSIAKDIRKQALMADASFKGTEFVHRLTRSRIILAETWAWSWVDVQLVNVMNIRWDEEQVMDRPRDWLDDMLEIATDALFFGTKLITFDPEKHPRLAAISSYPFTIRNFNNRRFSRTEDSTLFRNAVVDVLRQAIAEWSGLTSDITKNDRINRLRAQFVNIIRTTLGDPFLTTDLAWKTFTDFKPHKFIFDTKTRYSRLVPLNVLSKFKMALLNHPIVQDGTEEQKLYLRYCEQAPNESTFV